MDMNSYDARSLLDLISVTKDSHVEYQAAEALLKLWRRGADLESLVELLQSEISRKRLEGAYYLDELGGAVEGLEDVVLKLADDPLSRCRRAFVSYVVNARMYDQRVAEALSRCLTDSDLDVRTRVIEWAIRTSEDRLEDFSKLVESGVNRFNRSLSSARSNEFWAESYLKRGTRGLNIIRRLRNGDNIQDIMRDTPTEDSLVFDIFTFLDLRRDFYGGPL